MLQQIVIGLGATIVVGWSAIEGYRLHLLVHRHAPDLAQLIPRDGGAALGILLGSWVVARWLLL